MASDSSAMPSLLRHILHKLSIIVASKCDEKIFMAVKGKPDLVRQSTRSQYGDICIPRGVVNIAFPNQQVNTRMGLYNK